MIGGAAVMEAAVEAKNGRLYVVDGVLIPPSITPVLPHRCDVTETKILKVTIHSLLVLAFPLSWCPETAALSLA